MSSRKSDLVPVTPPELDLYMNDMYAKVGLGLGSSAIEVLNAAHSRWGVALETVDRIEVAELLLGRRIDNDEINTLPAEFFDHVAQGGPFEGLIAVTSLIAEVEHR